jgi:toxin ParE1/3/4
LTEAADADLSDIWLFLAVEASEAVADRFVDTIKARLQILSRFPRSGSARDDVAPGLRAFVHSRYLAYYRVLPDAVLVIRVVHGARDAAAIADRGGFDP